MGSRHLESAQAFAQQYGIPRCYDSYEALAAGLLRAETIVYGERQIEISGGVFMPQMNKGGKFIFGKSLIRTDGTLRIPPQAMEEYHIADEGKVYLFTGSKITGGFCVTRKGLLHPSKLGHILDLSLIHI